MIPVVVVSAVPALRAGLAAFLRADAQVLVVAEADSLVEMAALPPEVDLQVMTADALSPPDIARLSAAAGGTLSLLVLTESPGQVARLRQWPRLDSALAAWGALPLDASARELSAALRALHEGLIVVAPTLLPPSPTPRLDLRPDEEAPFEPLTVREAEVLQLLAQGLANKEIAVRLGISEHTAKFHVS